MPSRAELVNRANVMGLDPSGYPNDSKLEQKVIYLETNASTMAGTLATGTLTQGGAAANGDQVTIGSVTYTYKTALSGVKASSTLTSDATNVADGDTVSIGYLTYTFRTTLTNRVAFEVLIGAAAADSLDNLKKAINDSGTEGTHYSTGTYAHPEVTAEANADTTQEVTARNFGTAPNNIPTVESSAHLAWDDTTLGGASAIPGVANVPNEILLTGLAATELDSLKQAINNGDTEGAGEGEGTAYSYGTRPHPEVTATTNGASTQVVQARYMAVGEDIGTTDPVDTGTALSWGATTLASGVADQNAVDATAKAQVSGGKNV